MHIAEFMNIVRKKTTPTDEQAVWIIKVEGNQVFMQSGKMAWPTKRAAATALSNCIKDSVEYPIYTSRDISRSDAEKKYKQLLKEARDRRLIEIVQLRH